MWKATGAQALIENRWVWGFGRAGAAIRAVLIGQEQVDYKERNGYTYFEWKKGKSRKTVFNGSQCGDFSGILNWKLLA